MLLSDSKAKALGNPDINNRAKLGACIGTGNTNFAKYALTGRVAILMRVMLEEVKRIINENHQEDREKAFDDKISRPEIYNKLSVLPGEFSSVRLATKARIAISKLKQDYKNFGFLNLIEWRILREDIEKTEQPPPMRNQYRTIINEDNVFYPSIFSSMQENSDN